MGKTRLAPLGWKKGPFLQVRPAGKKSARATGEQYRRRDNLLRTLGFRCYAAYLASDLWKSIRERVFERDSHKCFCCSRKPYTAHHRRYTRENLLGENLANLVAICRTCHTAIERKSNGRKVLDETKVDNYLKRRRNICQANINKRKKHRALKPKGTEQHADRPPDTTGHKCCSPKGGSSDLGECVHSLAPSEDLACPPQSDK